MIRKLLIDNPTIQLLKRGLDASALRQRTVADHIANAGVAGPRPRAVQFGSLFRRAAPLVGQRVRVALREIHGKRMRNDWIEIR